MGDTVVAILENTISHTWLVHKGNLGSSCISEHYMNK